MVARCVQVIKSNNGGIMHRLRTSTIIMILILACCLLPTAAVADPTFDFGMPLFGLDDLRFEQSASPELNVQLLEKHINEHPDSIITQINAITRWFNLLRLSDTPRRDELIKLGHELFDYSQKAELSTNERLLEIYFVGMLLAHDREPDPSNAKDQAFEELLIAAEDKLADNHDYSIIKGILFQFLRQRPNDYFLPMKPEEDLKQALTIIPKTAHYYFILGQAFRMLGNQDSTLFLAIASYERASSLAPRSRTLQNALLSIYMSLHEEYQGRNRPEPFWLEEAVYKKILNLSPDNPYALNNLGYLYAEYGVNRSLAQELCQRAVDIMPDNAGFHDSLGWAAFKNGQYQKAIAELIKSVQLNPELYETYYHLGTVYYAAKEYDKAAEVYTRALQLKPDAVETLNNLAYLYTERNRNIDKALPMAEAAVRLEPNNASYIDTLGWVHYRLGNLEKALELLLRADQLAPGQGEILLHIGRVYLDMHKFESALAYVKQAFKEDPRLEDPDNSLYIALRLRGYHSALADYHKIFRERVDKDKVINILMGISRLYQEERMYDKAIQITSICSDIKYDRVSLAEPLFNSYEFEAPADESPAEDEIMEPELVSTELDEAYEDSFNFEPDEEEYEETFQAATEEEEEEILEPQNLFAGNPPLMIAVGPGFFKWAAKGVPELSPLSEAAVALIIANAKAAKESVIYRIELLNTSGDELFELITGYLMHMGGKVDDSIDESMRVVNFRNKQLFLLSVGNAIYAGRNMPGPDELIAWETLFDFNDNVFAAISCDWTAIQQAFPAFIRYFISNPIAPFNKVLATYKFDNNGTLNEYSVATTGQTEDNDFMKKLARELFAFKLAARRYGVEATIRVKSEDELIFISTDLENLAELIEKQTSFTRGVLRTVLTRAMINFRCFTARMLYRSDNTCPTGGKFDVDPETGIISCSAHGGMPAFSFFTTAAEACDFSRNRIKKIIEKSDEYTADLADENEIDVLLKTILLDYNIPLCPSYGVFELTPDNSVNCTEH